MAVVTAAMVALLAAASIGGAPTSADVATIAGFALAFTLVQLLPVPFPRGSQLELVRVEEAVVVPLVLMLDPAAALIAVASGVLVGQLLGTRTDPIKIAFNTAQIVLAVTGALAVTWAITGTTSPGYGVLPLAAAATGLIAMFIINQALVAGVMRIAAGVRYTGVLFDDALIKVAMWATNAAIGMLLVLPAIEAPALLLLGIVPLAMLHGAWRIHGERARDDRRLTDLGEAVDEITGGVPVERVAKALVQSAREVVAASCAQVHLYGDDHTVWVRQTESGEIFGEGRIGPLDEDEDRQTFEVELAGGEGILGELHVWHEPRQDGGAAPSFTRRDRTLLEMLANHAASALDNSHLTARSVIQQRTIKQVFDHSSEGLLVLDRRGRVRGWNPAMQAMSGFAEKTVTASPISLISPQLAGIPMSNGPGTVDAVISTADGEHRHVRASYAPIDDDGAYAATNADAASEADNENDVVGSIGQSWVIVVHDTTLEQETERLKNDFVATVSHELRTPLTAIKGFLDTMRRDDIELGAGQVRMFLQIMGDQADRLERLIGDLLDMSAIESGRPLEVDLTPVDVGVSVRNSILAFESARASAKVVYEESDVGLVVRADPQRLEQVLTNLLDNAFKHGGGEDPIEVRVSHDPDGTAMVSITDHGPGISLVDQRRIFERFFVTATSVTRTGGGAGLGLYICRRLVDAMTGKITVESRIGEGTTFTVSLLVLAATLPEAPEGSTAGLSLDEARDLLDADPR
ncbi:MAG: ATP-binding protein [Gaiellales bacterium]